MKKLFISCPMHGRTQEAIQESMDKMHKIAQVYTGENLEVIKSYIPGTCPQDTNRRIWYLGESIKMMANADVFIGFKYINDQIWPGCSIENIVAQCYGIRSILVDLEVLMPDAVEIERNFYNTNEQKVCVPPV